MNIHEALEQVLALQMNMSTQPEIPLTLVESSNVEAIGYDPATKTARVRFKGGATYRYQDVEPELFEIIRSAPSIGKAIGQLKKFPTTKEAPTFSPEVANALNDPSKEARLKRLAELEDGGSISVGGLYVDLAKEDTVDVTKVGYATLPYESRTLAIAEDHEKISMVDDAGNPTGMITALQKNTNKP